LKKHIPAFIVVLEEMDIVNDENERLPASFGAAKSDFFEFVQRCSAMSVTLIVI
jgi:hypothetical protein